MKSNAPWPGLAALLGLGGRRTSHLEKWVSGLGGLVGIIGVLIVSQQALGLASAATVVASMGASAVLLFAAPHGPLSQPWPVFGGHLISALIGVSCARWLGSDMLSAAIAVAVAIGAMHYLNCIHPPGGATALSAVIGGDAVHQLGYQFVITPVLINVLIILLIAVAFNFPFTWRRYPAVLASRTADTPPVPTQALSRDELTSAIKAMVHTQAVSEHDVDTLFHHALSKHQAEPKLRPTDIQRMACYSNDAYGADWQVRQVMAIDNDNRKAISQDTALVYRVVAGEARRSSGTTTCGEFARWANHAVFRNENSWQRCVPVADDDEIEIDRISRTA